MRTSLSLVALLSVSLATAARADDWRPQPGFRSLFNGHDLTGWCFRARAERGSPASGKVTETFDGKTESSDAGRYSARDGILTVNFPKGRERLISQLYTVEGFPGDFTLKLEFRASVNADSGIFVRRPQLQCRDYLVAGPYKDLKKYRPQDWNEIEVVVKNGVARCTCNGEVLEAELKLPETGPIGLEGDRGQMEYRHLQINAAPPQRPRDAVADAQTPQPTPAERPEQKKTAHDLSDVFTPSKATPSSGAIADQPERGGMNGFDFYRDPLGAPKPGMTFEEGYRAAVANKPTVLARQRKLLESRYDLEPKLDPQATMSRGKPLVVGPTARLPQGIDWDAMAAMSPAEVRRRDAFPYKALPHPVQGGGLGGQVFPRMQIRMFPRLERYDVEFDLPEVFLPEFPPAMYLQNRPELGDVSRGEVISINNYYRLFKDLLTPVQLDGLRLLLTPFPQEEFNPTDDRKSAEPSLGVTCFDCHVNGHTSGQFHITPDIRPEQRRIRLDTVSLRGVFNQQIHGSKRSLRSVEDFTEFEQRTAYFNGDPIHAMKKGMNILDRIQVTHMAQLQNMLDFPPAPKLTVLGRLDPAKATEGERRGETLFFGKAQCAVCHPSPFYLDNRMHDLHVERFLEHEAGDGPIKSFTLRGIKDSPPYLHDGRCLTLEDTVEFFNLVLELKLTKDEKHDLVAFLRQL